jgi:phosphoglycolate phosphatase
MAPPTATAPPRPPPATTPTTRPLTLVTWDIDGTLLRATGDRANALHRSAFEAAWQAVYGTRIDLASLPHQGSTDPLILIKGAVTAGLAAGAGEVMGSDGDNTSTTGSSSVPLPPTAVAGSPLAAMVRAMLAHFSENAHTVADGLELLPGVEALLAALSAREDVLVGLVTGNLRPIADAKVSALGVRHHFHSSEDGCGMGCGGGGDGGDGSGSDPSSTAPPAPLGGFGSDHCSGGFEAPAADRAELIRVAARRAAAVAGLPEDGYPSSSLSLRVAHLGDTPFDVRAALAAGATPVGVATGVHSREELEAAGGPGVVVLDDLTDTAAALAALGLGE